MESFSYKEIMKNVNNLKNIENLKIIDALDRIKIVVLIPFDLSENIRKPKVWQ